MALRKIIYDRCMARTGITDIVSTRVYPNQLPENVTYPALTYKAPVSASDAGYRDHSAPTTRTVDRVQLDSYAATGDAAEALADQVGAAFNGWKSDAVDVGYSFVANRIDFGWQSAINVYRQMVDIMIEHSI